MESYLNENFLDVHPKRSSEKALQRWRKLCWLLTNPKRRFRFTANLSMRYKAAAMQALEVVFWHRKIDWTKIMVVISMAVDPGFPRQTPPNDAVELERIAQPAELGAVAPIAPAQPARGDGKLDWTKMLVGFFFEATIALALLPVQGHSEVPTSFHWFFQAMLLGFCSLFVSESIPYNFVVTAALLQKLGLFFMFTAILIAITSQVPFYFKCTSWAAYFISILVIFISRCFLAWKLIE